MLTSVLPFQGNYDAYVRTRFELEENQMKRYKWEQDQISHMKVILHSMRCVHFVIELDAGMYRITLLDLVMVIRNLHVKLKVKRRY
jgi:hypothetical protein